MQRIVISVLSALIVFLLGFRGFPILEPQGLTAVCAAFLVGGFMYWMLSFRSKIHAQTKEAIDGILRKVEEVASVAEGNRNLSVRSFSTINDLKNRSAKQFETVHSFLDVKFNRCFSVLESIVFRIESQTEILREASFACKETVMEVLGCLKAMDDCLGTGLAGIRTDLEALTVLSEALPEMRKQLIGTIQSTSAQTAEAISYVQSDLGNLDKVYHDIIEQIEQFSTRSDENRQNVMTAFTEGLNSQAVLLKDVGDSSTKKVIDTLGRLKEMDESLESELTDVGSNLEAVKALSEIIPGMRERIIGDIYGATTKISQLSIVIDSIKSQCRELIDRVGTLDDNFSDRIEDLHDAFEKSQFELINDIDENLNRRESQMERERELGDREIQILKEIEAIITK